jgi:hypothetical protein
MINFERTHMEAFVTYFEIGLVVLYLSRRAEENHETPQKSLPPGQHSNPRGFQNTKHVLIMNDSR